MGTYSHTLDRELPLTISSPPTVPRRCEGRAAWGGPCSSYAVPFVQEVAYCGHHLPREYIALADNRRDLWRRLSIDVWAEVLAEYPAEAPKS